MNEQQLSDDNPTPDEVRHILAGAWQERYVRVAHREARFEHFMDFVTAYPPEGLHTDVRTLERLCADDSEATALLAKETQRPVGSNQYSKGVYIVHTLQRRSGGNSPQSAIRRLRKTRPDLHAQVLAGELSPHAAGDLVGRSVVRCVHER